MATTPRRRPMTTAEGRSNDPTGGPRMSTPKRYRPVPGLVGQDGVGVEVPGWLALWLEENTTLSVQRVALRGRDPGVDDLLSKMHYCAMSWAGSATGSGDGTGPGDLAEPAGTLDMGKGRLTVGAAAALIGVTDRAVRRAITEGRLPATKSDTGQYVINRDDAETYRANRAATA